MLKYEKKSLFEVQGKVILTHAANCKGVMGSGIAAEFKRRYPEAVRAYEWDFDRTGQRGSLPTISAGTSKLYKTSNPNIYMGCLFTSWNYGKLVDKPDTILEYTRLALPNFLRRVQRETPEFKIYSNKFNSGLFNVPWEKTEALIVEALKAFPDTDWVVCDPQLAPSSNG